MDLVEGSEAVERIFGAWPSFHDAEVLNITLDREACGAVHGPTVRFTVHAFQTTQEVDSHGHFVRQNHVLVQFALYSAEVLHLHGFNLQNVLSRLRFSEPAEPAEPHLAVQVDLECLYGVSASFQCAKATVMSVEPFDAPGRVAS